MLVPRASSGSLTPFQGSSPGVCMHVCVYSVSQVCVWGKCTHVVCSECASVGEACLECVWVSCGACTCMWWMGWSRIRRTSCLSRGVCGRCLWGTVWCGVCVVGLWGACVCPRLFVCCVCDLCRIVSLCSVCFKVRGYVCGACGQPLLHAGRCDTSVVQVVCLCGVHVGTADRSLEGAASGAGRSCRCGSGCLLFVAPWWTHAAGIS